MITLIGVGHVFDLGGPLRDAVVSRQPKVVGLELDVTRYVVLYERARDPALPAPREFFAGDAAVPRAGAGPHPDVRLLPAFVAFRLLALFQHRIAESYGVDVGDEMLAAARAAREVGAVIALIDQDARTLLPGLWEAMTFDQRVRLLGSAVASLFARRRRIEAELTRYQESEEAYLEEFGRQYPAVRKVLLEDRNDHMAATIRRLDAAHGRVVAVVGDGHVEGLQRRLPEDTEVLRLHDLRAPASASGSTATVSYRL